MPKKKKPAEVIPKELPEEETPLEALPEVPKVELKPTVATTETAKQRQEKWDSIESELQAVRQDYIAGKITFEEVIDKLVAALTVLKAAEEPGLAGLGARPEMAFPVPPAVPPEEEIPPIV
jgi:hypothetical protein